MALALPILITLALAAPDRDGDGIPNDVEDLLLERHRPFYAFSRNLGQPDDVPPTDVYWYLQQCQLYDTRREEGRPTLDHDVMSVNPYRVLDQWQVAGAADLTKRPERTEWHLNVTNDRRTGSHPWAAVQREGNVGLWGHVTAIRADPDDAQSAVTGIKVEYWQFFAYNAAHLGGPGDHEGDWESVQLVVEPTAPYAIRSVSHYAHGTPMTYEMSATTRQGPWPGDQYQYVGSGDWSYFLISLASQWPRAQNNTVRFAKGPDGAYTHPVVFVEMGTHGFWPTEHWAWPTVPAHGGDLVAFLARTPPNLGEVEAPSSRLAALILRYNGRWGAWGLRNDPPVAPALHTGWQWPAGSALRRRIPKGSFDD